MTATPEPGLSEKSLTTKLAADALPIGLLPPSFPSDYVAGAVVPYLLSGIFYGETPSVPMIDLALSKEEAVPIQFWGLLYEGWTPNPEEEGYSVFLQGYAKRGPNNERKKIYMSATTPDLIDTKYRGKIVHFFERFLAQSHDGKPMMESYFQNYYDLYWDLHVGATGDAIPTEVRQYSSGFNAVLGFWYPNLDIVLQNYLQARKARRSHFGSLLDEERGDRRKLSADRHPVRVHTQLPGAQPVGQHGVQCGGETGADRGRSQRTSVVHAHDDERAGQVRRQPVHAARPVRDGAVPLDLAK
jgi:hypothetical protein